MIKAIVYDFDGVICDSVDMKTKAFAHMYEQHGEDIVKKVVSYHLDNGGISRFEKFKYFEKTFFNKELSEDDVQQMGDDFSSIVLQKVIASSYLPGAYEFISGNADSYLQFICTGTPENEIMVITAERGISHFFRQIYGSPKTKDAILDLIMKEFSLLPNEILFIGDAMTDYKAATKTGVLFAGIENHATVFPDSTFLVRDFNDIRLNKLLHQ